MVSMLTKSAAYRRQMKRTQLGSREGLLLRGLFGRAFLSLFSLTGSHLLGGSLGLGSLTGNTSLFLPQITLLLLLASGFLLSRATCFFLGKLLGTLSLLLQALLLSSLLGRQGSFLMSFDGLKLFEASFLCRCGSNLLLRHALGLRFLLGCLLLVLLDRRRNWYTGRWAWFSCFVSSCSRWRCRCRLWRLRFVNAGLLL
jgi:hypothetical protein